MGSESKDFLSIHVRLCILYNVHKQIRKGDVSWTKKPENHKFQINLFSEINNLDKNYIITLLNSYIDNEEFDIDFIHHIFIHVNLFDYNTYEKLFNKIGKNNDKFQFVCTLLHHMFDNNIELNKQDILLFFDNMKPKNKLPLVSFISNFLNKNRNINCEIPLTILDLIYYIDEYCNIDLSCFYYLDKHLFIKNLLKKDFHV